MFENNLFVISCILLLLSCETILYINNSFDLTILVAFLWNKTSWLQCNAFTCIVYWSQLKNVFQNEVMA